ncbi:MAG: transaldolase [Actinobacteria bacterium]|nr:transaldolase [Actinomycetota bacterium]
MGSNPLTQLQGFGQSVWYDNIGRGLLVAGGLKKMVDEDAVVGLTSNPSIFQKAIATTDEYDSAIAELVASGADAERVLDTLMAEDVGMAADLLHATFDTTGSVDGWVSIEVNPALAYDTENTVVEARRLRALVGRPNVLVKVPATEQGIPAIERLISEGLSVNVTLIFSIDRYREVMGAYLTGMEHLITRRAEGEDLPEPASVRSVASFFVSRVDSLCDTLLEAAADGADAEQTDALLALRGQAAVANAKLAYQAFLETFAGPRWEKLESAGAKVQRPLWASTSTKNKAYSDVLYVDELIGPDTVNTMPHATLEAYRDHGDPRVTLTQGVEAARRLIGAIELAGIAMSDVTSRLEAEGVAAFADSFESLMATLRAKRDGLAGGQG